MEPVFLDKERLGIEDVVAIARHGAPAELSAAGEGRIQRARDLVERWVAEERTIYGITTGFGALSHTRIPPEDTATLQQNIILSHAAGVGEPLAEEIVRAVMAIRVHDLALGFSGIRLETVQYLLRFLNKGVWPVVPAKGSVGASGDLAPMSHLCLVLIGQGEAFFRGARMPGDQVLAQLGIPPLRLAAGEGLALVNGTQVMTAIAALALQDAESLTKTADVACAMSLEVLMGTDAEFDPRIHQARPHPGQIAAAANLRRLTQQSQIMLSHRGCSRLQDAYTLRCSPQIHGAVRNAVSHVREVVATELNSTTTNPLVFADTEEILAGGNFHGQPVALAADYLGMAVAELGNVSERRVERLVNPQLSELPAFLVHDGGLNSGFMIAQYTAAALVSENKVLAHPASVDSIPTSANKEDHVSMGTVAARKAREILQNVEYVLAVELLCAAQALDLLGEEKPYAPGKGTAAARKAVREHVAYLESDRVLAGDMATVAGLIRSGSLLRAVEEAVGPLE